MPYDAASYNMLAVSWPALGARPVTLGGTAVPFSEAVRTASENGTAVPPRVTGRAPSAGHDTASML